MEEIDFTLDGDRYHLTRQQVIDALNEQTPGQIYTYWVDVEGRAFPIKQALASALRIPKTRFISTRAEELLGKLGFRVFSSDEVSPAGLGPETQLPPAPTRLDSRRERALALAVQLAAAHSMSPEGALAVAVQFDEWLAS